MKERLNLRTFFRKLWTSFSAAAVLSAAITVLLIAQDCLPGMENAVKEYTEIAVRACAGGLCFAVLGSLMSRYYGMPRWLGWAAAAAGIAFSLVIKENDDIYLGVCLAAAAMCFYYASGREKRTQRLAQIGGCFLSSLGLAICLFAALMLCSYAMEALFLSNRSRVGSVLFSISVYSSFLLAAPWLFLGRLPQESDDAESRNGFRKITANLFLPCYLVLTGILLCYIATILVRWEMPVGQMNGLALTAMTLYAGFHLTLTGEENRISAFFKRWGAWLMLPVLAVQQVGVWMRYDAYGLTPARYAGMAITLLLALSVLWGLLRKRADWFFAGAAVLVLVLLVSPLNVENVARYDQEKRLKTALEACGMLDEYGKIIPNPDADEENQRIILSASEYLRWLEDVPEESFTAALKQQAFEGGKRVSDELLFGFPDDAKLGWETYYAYGTDSRNAVDVSGFRYAEWYDETADFENQAEGNALIVPAQQLMDAADWKAEALLQKAFMLEDGRVFRPTRLVLTYEDGVQDSIRIQGWILTPEE